MDRSKLETEMASAVSKEKEAVAIDAMKKRAITAAKSYDEFKNMVACASLTPLGRADFASRAVISSNRAVHGGSAAGSSSAAMTAAATSASAALSSLSGGTLAVSTSSAALPALRSAGDFEREWRRLEQTARARFK